MTTLDKNETLKVNDRVTFQFKNDKEMIDCILTYQIMRMEEKRIYLTLVRKDGSLDTSMYAVQQFGYTKFYTWMRKYKVAN